MGGKHRASHLRRVNQSRSVPLRVGTGGMLVTLLAGGAVTYTEKKAIDIEYDGTTLHVTTVATTVNRALASSGVVVADDQQVIPSPNHRLRDGMTVRIEQIPTRGYSPQFREAASELDQSLSSSSHEGTTEVSGRTREAQLPSSFPASSVPVAPSPAPVAPREEYSSATSSPVSSPTPPPASLLQPTPSAVEEPAIAESMPAASPPPSPSCRSGIAVVAIPGSVAGGAGYDPLAQAQAAQQAALDQLCQ